MQGTRDNFSRPWPLKFQIPTGEVPRSWMGQRVPTPCMHGIFAVQVFVRGEGSCPEKDTNKSLGGYENVLPSKSIMSVISVVL